MSSIMAAEQAQLEVTDTTVEEMETPKGMQEIDGIPVFGNPVDEGALLQAKRCWSQAEGVALMDIPAL